MRKNIKATSVNLTLNMRYKNDKQYQICHHQSRFFKLKMHQNLFSIGAPDPAGGYPLPIPLPARRLRRLELGAPTAPRFSGPLNTKSWLRQWPLLHCQLNATAVTAVMHAANQLWVYRDDDWYY